MLYLGVCSALICVFSHRFINTTTHERLDTCWWLQDHHWSWSRSWFVKAASEYLRYICMAPSQDTARCVVASQALKLDSRHLHAGIARNCSKTVSAGQWPDTSVDVSDKQPAPQVYGLIRLMPYDTVRISDVVEKVQATMLTSGAQAQEVETAKPWVMTPCLLERLRTKKWSSSGWVIKIECRLGVLSCAQKPRTNTWKKWMIAWYASSQACCGNGKLMGKESKAEAGTETATRRRTQGFRT